MADNDVQITVGAQTDDLDSKMRQSAEVVEQSQQTIVDATTEAKESFQDLGAAAAKWAQITADATSQASQAIRTLTVDYKGLIEAATGVSSATKSAADSGQFFEDMLGITADRARALREALTTVDGGFTDLGSRFAPAANAAAGGLGAMSGAAREASGVMAGFYSLNRAGRMELQAAAINFVQGVSSGISPLKMLQTEGTQVLGALIQGGALTASTMIGVGGAIAVAAAGVIGLAVAYEQGVSQSKAFNAAVQVTNNAAGMTASAMAGIREQAIKAGDISAGTAQQIATDMIGTGQISGEVIGRLINLTADYASATNQSASEAGAALTKSFEDPAKAMKALDDAFNLLSDAQRQHIRDLIDQGDKTEAQIALSDALGSRIHQMADQDLGYLAQALKAGGEAWDTFWDKAQRIGRTESIGEQLDEAREKLTQLQAGAAQAQAGGAISNLFGGSQGQAASDQAAIAAQKVLIANLEQQQAAETATAAMQEQSAKAQELSKTMGDAARAADAFGAKQHDLQNQIIAANNAAKAVQAEIDNLGNASSGPDLKKLGELNQALTNSKTVADNAAGALKALRTPLQEAQDALKISQQVAALPKDQQAPMRAKLTTEDQLSHSADPTDRAEADARAELAFQKAAADQSTELARQSAQEQIAALDAQAAAAQQGSQERINILKQEAEVAKATFGEQSTQYQQVQGKINEATRQAAQQQLADKVAALDAEAAKYQSGSTQRIAILKQETALVAQQYGEQSKQYQDALAKQLAAERQHQQQILQLKMDGVQAQQDLALLGVQDQRNAYDADVQADRLTNSQKIAQLQQFENQEYQIRQRAIQQQIALLKQSPDTNPQQLQKLNNQLLVLERQHSNQVNQIERQSVQQTRQQYQNLISPVTSAFGSIVSNSLSGNQTMAQSASQAALSIANSFINAGEEWLTNYLTNLIIGQTAQQTSADTQITTNAATAASGAYSSASSIPYIGWIIAPAAAAAALGAVLAFKGGFAVGTPSVPADMMTTVHKGEIIVPATMSDAIRSGQLSLGGPGGGNGGGGNNFGPIHVHGALSQSQGMQTGRNLLKGIRAAARDNPGLRLGA